MLSFLRKRWFLVGLLIAIGGGLPLGFALPAEQLEQLRSRIGASQTGYVVAFVLFLMSFSLDGRKLPGVAGGPRAGALGGRHQSGGHSTHCLADVLDSGKR